MTVDGSLENIDWDLAKSDLAADDFDNGRSADALRRSFGAGNARVPVPYS